MMKENATANKNKNKGGGGTNTSTLAGLLQEDYTSSGDSYFIDNAWRGAEVSCDILFRNSSLSNSIFQGQRIFF